MTGFRPPTSGTFAIIDPKALFDNDLPAVLWLMGDEAQVRAFVDAMPRTIEYPDVEPVQVESVLITDTTFDSVNFLVRTSRRNRQLVVVMQLNPYPRPAVDRLREDFAHATVTFRTWF